MSEAIPDTVGEVLVKWVCVWKSAQDSTPKETHPYNVFEHMTSEQRQASVTALRELARDPQFIGGNTNAIVEAVLRAQDKMTIAGVPRGLIPMMTSSIVGAAQRPATVQHALDELISSARVEQ
jgi:hypothetical protein